jgi:hypothetical protein
MLVALIATIVGQASAQDLKIRDVFKQMPDSLMPYLTGNNRLDFIDFMDSNMKASVSNQTGGNSEMTALTDDSLSIRMSDALRVDMMLMSLDEPVDSIRQVIVFVETFLTDTIYGESVCKIYTVDWQPVTKDVPFNEAQKSRLSESLSWKSPMKTISTRVFILCLTVLRPTVIVRMCNRAMTTISKSITGAMGGSTILKTMKTISIVTISPIRWFGNSRLTMEERIGL